MKSKPTRTEGEPHDRLTRICAEMMNTLAAHLEYQKGSDKCIVFMVGREGGGMVLHGYDNDTEAMADLFIHLKALFAVNGKQIEFHAISDRNMN